MKKVIVTAIAVSTFYLVHAQNTQYAAFNRDKELELAIQRYDFKSFISENVTFTYDTLERNFNADGINQLMKQYFIVDKKSVVKKAAETNNGYTQTYGIYKNDIAVMYIRFEFDQETMMLKEITLERN
jgi:hypothetical protein